MDVARICEAIDNEDLLELALATHDMEDLNVLSDGFSSINNHKCTLLMYAIRKRKISVIEWLVERGVDLSIQDTRGRTPLSIAITTGDIHVVNPLLNAGADAKFVSESGHTFAHYTAAVGSDDLLDVAIKYGVDLNATTDMGMTAFHVAVKEGNFDLAVALLDKGARITPHIYTNGIPLLHMATTSHTTDLVGRIIRAGANINTLDHERKTALHHACARTNYRATKALLLAGGDLDQRDSLGISPRDMIFNVMKSQLQKEGLM